MSQAQEVYDQIIALHSAAIHTKHVCYYHRHSDLAARMRVDTIDYNVPVAHKCNGRDESFDNSLIVYYYKDNSVLISSTSGLTVR